MALIQIQTTESGAAFIDPNKDLDEQISNFTPEIQAIIKANLQEEAEKLQAEVDTFIAERTTDGLPEDEDELRALQFDALDNADFSTRAADLASLGIESDLITSINDFSADPGDRPITEEEGGGSGTGDVFNDGGGGDDGSGLGGTTVPDADPGDIGGTIKPPGEEDAVLHTEEPHPDQSGSTGDTGTDTGDVSGSLGFGDDGTGSTDEDTRRPAFGDHDFDPTLNAGGTGAGEAGDEGTIGIVGPDGEVGQFNRSDLIRQNFVPSFSGIINERLGGLGGGEELDPSIGAPEGTTQRDLILRSFNPSFGGIINEQLGGLEGVGGPADQLLERNAALGEFNPNTSQGDLRTTLEGLVSSRLGDPGLPTLDAATSAQLDAIRAGDEAGIETQFQEDRQSLLENLFGKNVQESTIATDATGRLLFGRDQLSAQAAAADAQRRLDVRSGIGERNIQQTGLAGSILSDLFGTEIQRGLGEQELVQGERQDLRGLLQQVAQLQLGTAGQQAGILQTGAELGLDERRVNTIQDDLVQRILATGGELSLQERGLDIERELALSEQGLVARGQDITADTQREGIRSREDLTREQIELDRFLAELADLTQRKSLDVEFFLGNESFKNNLEVAQIQAKAGQPGALQSILGTIGAVAGFFSSQDFKEFIEPDVHSSELLMSLKPVTYNYKPGLEHIGTTGRNHGLIAEEVEKVFPEAVFRDPKGKVIGIHYVTLIGPMLAEIQKLRRELDEVKNAA